MTPSDFHTQALAAKPFRGDEPFRAGSDALPWNLGEFWSWAFSDLVSNANRGILAEFIVARALGLQLTVRNEWDAFDLLFGQLEVEVKSSGYVQTWRQERLSSIQFNISPSQALIEGTNNYADERKRQADVYVFALLNHMDRLTVNPLDLSQWTFWVLPTAVLDEKCPSKSPSP